MIQFVLVEDHVRFSVNLDACNRHGVGLSSELLKVAVTVTGKAGDGRGEMTPGSSSISAKLMWMNVVVSATVLVLAMVAFFFYDLISFRRNLIHESRDIGADRGNQQRVGADVRRSAERGNDAAGAQQLAGRGVGDTGDE